MADATKTTARQIGHMTYTQAPAVHEKNIFHLFGFTQPVKNYSFSMFYTLIKHGFLTNQTTCLVLYTLQYNIAYISKKYRGKNLLFV